MGEGGVGFLVRGSLDRLRGEMVWADFGRYGTSRSKMVV